MILDVRDYSGRDIREYLPLIESGLTFYNEFYQMQERKRSGRPLTEDGKLVIFPGTALETYKDAMNPSTTLAAPPQRAQGRHRPAGRPPRCRTSQTLAGDARPPARDRLS